MSRKLEIHYVHKHITLEKLKLGAYKWNEWIDHFEMLPQYDDLRMQGIIIGRIDLSGEDLSGMDLEKYNFHRALLIGTNLSNANLSNAQITNVDFSNANLEKANLYDSSASLSKFDGANLTEACLQDADFRRASFRSANLSKADLKEANLKEADFSDANLFNANLTETSFLDATLSNANLENADISIANLTGANLQQSNLKKVNINHSILYKTNLKGADLTEADLTGSNFIKTNVENALFDKCLVYGVSAWDLEGKVASQKDLVITDQSILDNQIVTVDDIEVAQFIYLMLNNKNIRKVLTTITGKGVLILGRFSPPERKRVLDAMREQLRKMDYVPMVFDFERVKSRDYTETVQILAGMSRFIIADITSPKSTPLELQATAPNFKIPFVPIIQKEERAFAMFSDLKGKFNWVLEELKYESEVDLLKAFQKGIIDRAIEKEKELFSEKEKEKIRHDEEGNKIDRGVSTSAYF